MSPEWMQKLLRLAFVIVFGLSTLPACSAIVECPNTLAREAEIMVPTIASWAELKQGFLRFNACDDGLIAAGFSDRVVHLLGEDQEGFRTLARLAKGDGVFATFVFDHVDATADADGLRQILRQLDDRGCGRLLDDHCSLLRSRLDEAMNELADLPSEKGDGG